VNNLDITKIPLDDQKTWDLICSGNTKGVFQLETNLGKHWCKECKPRSIEELSDVISAIRPGCISGDSLITIKNRTYDTRSNTYAKKTIRELCNNAHKVTSLLSLDTSSKKIIDNGIEDIFYSGEKECFEVLITNYSKGKKRLQVKKKWHDLECTAEHKMLTSDLNWVSLKDLKPGQRIACLKKASNKTRMSNTISNRHVKDGPRMPNVDGTRYFAEICYKNYIEECVICDWDETSLDTHHIEGNRHTNNKPENLAYLCPNCHRMHNMSLISTDEILTKRKEKELPKFEGVEWVTYLGKKSVGVKDTYDITMKSPNNNFIAGNFIVHNSLKAKQDGKSMTQHYADRKSSKEEMDSLYGPIDHIVASTQSIILYQEQSMKIAQVMAGFSEQQSDTLRKSIGKKNASLMAEVKVQFLEGCKQQGHSKEDSERIFEIIEKSSRYSFNKCLALDTLVELENGDMITIEDVSIGDKVKTPDGYAVVKNKYNNGIQDVFRVNIGCKEIKCTITHKFLSKDGKILPLWSFLFTGQPIHE